MGYNRWPMGIHLLNKRKQLFTKWLFCVFGLAAYLVVNIDAFYYGTIGRKSPLIHSIRSIQLH
ncbi:hypothetical protein K450DRAFT_252347 [Umbelopsis ramanniana AG]|uniref:Uncharacterized protein n=1 Tax=Umbelopsis ramanniana AG TaxID=1314678 RepID=A0AAD5E639_UMBRA|nr:uncharacterized protein K450DRAFT_252347 [Umbelopsis ramanniana AG]KAI8577422.1 hypothetical protein K450DRAFT_252347 [Umbelopsis ramanniana AG]